MFSSSLSLGTDPGYPVGTSNVYVSIFESNSEDATPDLLRDWAKRLDDHGIDHRITSTANDGRQSFGIKSRQRIAYLAETRNKVLEPIQSVDPRVRVPEYASFTKIIFLNDIVFRWQDIVRLIDTRTEGQDREDYDMACALDFAGTGFYDNWVFRDICGSPSRTAWPYVRDSISRQAMRKEVPFPVAACWNGAVVLNAGPFLYNDKKGEQTDHHHSTDLERRDWSMIDNSSFPDSAYSPNLTAPIRFRTSGIETCNHSECFLLPYDLHRLYADVEGRPKILVNPTVKVAYEVRQYNWFNFVIRTPVFQWWTDVWRSGFWFDLLDPIIDATKAKRDRCTWAALKIPTKDGRCPPLPGRLVPGDNWA